MRIQQMKKRAITRAGFTLVELIVVITILAILGTIAFVSFQGQSGEARDSARKTEISQLISKISITRANGVSILNLVTPNTTNQMSLIALGGSGASAQTGRYTAGNPNYSALQLKAEDCDDPSLATQSYVIAATSYQGGRFQIASTMENA